MLLGPSPNPTKIYTPSRSQAKPLATDTRSTKRLKKSPELDIPDAVDKSTRDKGLESELKVSK